MILYTTFTRSVIRSSSLLSSDLDHSNWDRAEARAASGGSGHVASLTLISEIGLASHRDSLPDKIYSLFRVVLQRDYDVSV